MRIFHLTDENWCNFTKIEVSFEDWRFIIKPECGGKIKPVERGIITKNFLAILEDYLACRLWRLGKKSRIIYKKS